MLHINKGEVIRENCKNNAKKNSWLKAIWKRMDEKEQKTETIFR